MNDDSVTKARGEKKYSIRLHNVFKCSNFIKTFGAMSLRLVYSLAKSEMRKQFSIIGVNDMGHSFTASKRDQNFKLGLPSQRDAKLNQSVSKILCRQIQHVSLCADSQAFLLA